MAAFQCIYRFWEFVIMSRKAIFVAFGLLRDDRLVWTVYLGGTCMTLALQVKLEPFKCDGANQVERNFLLVQTVTLALGGAFTFGLDTTSHASRSSCCGWQT